MYSPFFCFHHMKLCRNLFLHLQNMCQLLPLYFSFFISHMEKSQVKILRDSAGQSNDPLRPIHIWNVVEKSTSTCSKNGLELQFATRPHFLDHCAAFQCPASLCAVQVCSYSSFDEKRPCYILWLYACPDCQFWNIKVLYCHSLHAFITPINTVMVICLECCPENRFCKPWNSLVYTHEPHKEIHHSFWVITI